MQLGITGCEDFFIKNTGNDGCQLYKAGCTANTYVDAMEWAKYSIAKCQKPGE